MRTSQYLLVTYKEAPAEAETASHQYMLRSGMIKKLAAGIYTWLPLGLRVLRNIEQIVREEMNAVGAMEILMPSLHPAELWQETGRWDNFEPPLLKIKDRHKRDFCYASTHEESVTDLIRDNYHSYKQLPAILYQIQTKFRDEARPRSGVQRAREFTMKDAYSIDIDEASAVETYQTMFDAYHRIFNKIGLRFCAVEAATGSIGGSVSHEFQALAEAGEDKLAINQSGTYAANIECAENLKAGDPAPNGDGTIEFVRGIEIGHIFQLGDKYSKQMNALVLNKNGKEVPVQMGCYGIGISRLVATIIEQHHDNDGIIWPQNVAPFQVAIVPIMLHKSARLREACDALYQKLRDNGYTVLYDDRDERPGVMFSTMDLIGIPHRLVLSEKHLDNNKIEYKARKDKDSQLIDINTVIDFLR